MKSKLLSFTVGFTIPIALSGCGILTAIIMDQANRSQRAGDDLRRFKDYEKGTQVIDLDELYETPDSQ